MATSADGLTFHKLNMIFCDSADVPDAIIGPNNSVYLFYQGLITHWSDGIKVAISNNGINNWQHYQVIIPGTENWPGKPCDPDVIMFGDTFRLYFTGDPINDMQPETYSAFSLDGIHFNLENGIRFQVAGFPVLDPTLLWTNGTLQYFAGGAPANFNWHAHSTNGLQFVQQSNFNINNLMMANGISAITSGYRFYCFSNNPNDRNIRSIYSSDGENWILENGFRLQHDSTNPLEYLYVKDPAIVYKDSCYIMYYVTRKRPNCLEETPDNSQKIIIYPNPFSITVQIRLGCDIKNINIYDKTGRLIKSFGSEHYIYWNGRDNYNRIVQSGIYFLGFEKKGKKFVRKIIKIDKIYFDE
ncbi:MAG: T9SS type A sorting domain-containing protein [candidate division WOR-3 bacterium]|nr:T9SS type A sorting domain-containing protein [candidate division WOR-3 bacterium]